MKSRLSLSQVRRFSESATSSHTPLEKPWADELIRISEAKLLKTESVLVSPQGPHPTILTAPRAKVGLNGLAATFKPFIPFEWNIVLWFMSHKKS